MILFAQDAAVEFCGVSYAEASRRREAFEVRCWDVGIIPLRGPTLSASIRYGVVRLECGYRFADLAGNQTTAARQCGCDEAAECRSYAYLGLW